jgi:shikimate dehydrogenase
VKRKYGLIGYPLEHSFSINYFNSKFKSENIDAEYINFEIKDLKELKYILHEHPDLCGFGLLCSAYFSQMGVVARLHCGYRPCPRY